MWSRETGGNCACPLSGPELLPPPARGGVGSRAGIVVLDGVPGQGYLFITKRWNREFSKFEVRKFVSII